MPAPGFQRDVRSANGKRGWGARAASVRWLYREHRNLILHEDPVSRIQCSVLLHLNCFAETVGIFRKGWKSLGMRSYRSWILFCLLFYSFIFFFKSTQKYTWKVKLTGRNVSKPHRCIPSNNYSHQTVGCEMISNNNPSTCLLPLTNLLNTPWY